MSGSNRTQSAHAQQTHQRDEIGAIATTFDVQTEKYSKTLPSNVPVDAFRNAFLTAVQRRPALLSADRNSLWLSLQQCAGDGLLPDGREAALVIFNEDAEDEQGNAVARGGRPKQVVYMPMIRGLRKLCRNTGVIAGIDATLVYRGEVIKIWREDGQKHFKHEVNTDPDADDSPNNIIGAYAVVTYKDGSWEGEWMSRSNIERVKAISRAKKGPWGPWYDEMSRKTVLRRLLKQLDASPELRLLDRALENDPTLGPEIDGEMTDISEALGKPPPPPMRRKADTSQQQDDKKDAPKTDAPDDPNTWRKEMEGRKEGPTGPVDKDTSQQNQKTEAGTQQADTGQTDTEGFYADLVDANSESLTQEPYSDPVKFAHDLAALVAKDAANMDAILELNAGAIEDACDASEKAKAIIDAIQAPKEEAKPGPKEIVAVAVPVTAKNAQNWQAYGEACRIDLETCQTLNDVEAWTALNRATYKERAIEGKIISHIRKRRAELGDTGHEQEPAQPSFDEKLAALGKMNMTEIQRQQADATHRRWLNDLFPPDKVKWNEAEQARLAELRSGA